MPQTLCFCGIRINFLGPGHQVWIKICWNHLSSVVFFLVRLGWNSNELFFLCVCRRPSVDFSLFSPNLAQSNLSWRNYQFVKTKGHIFSRSDSPIKSNLTQIKVALCKGDLVCLNEGLRSFPNWDNNDIPVVKIHWQLF